MVSCVQLSGISMQVGRHAAFSVLYSLSGIDAYFHGVPKLQPTLLWLCHGVRMSLDL